jgi:hypothetical protein
MRGRVGTWVIVGAWVLLLPLGRVSEGFGTLVVVCGFVLLVVHLRSLRYLDWDEMKERMVFLPVTEREVRHNERAKLIRKRERLEARFRVSQDLIDVLGEDEKWRRATVEAERDAARREIIRVEEDIKRLQAGWRREDRERDYRNLTG